MRNKYGSESWFISWEERENNKDENSNVSQLFFQEDFDYPENNETEIILSVCL